jgi:hypothetical protein
MAILTVTPIVRTGINPATPMAAAAGGGDSFANTGNEFLKVTNGGGSSINVTIVAQAACSDYGVSNAAHDIVVAVPNGQTRDIGPINPKVYNDANGRAQITYSGVTTVTVAPFSMGRA